MANEDCIFCKIIAGQIPSRKVYEDEELFAFHDIHPQAPVHFLVIPKVHVASLADTGQELVPLLGRILHMAPQLALANGCNPGPEGGFKVVISTGREGGQEVDHLHVHILGGPRPWRRG